jgi:hypothetical protein
VPCTLLKGISDTAGEGDRRMLRGNLDLVTTALTKTVLGILLSAER